MSTSCGRPRITRQSCAYNRAQPQARWHSSHTTTDGKGSCQKLAYARLRERRGWAPHIRGNETQLAHARPQHQQHIERAAAEPTLPYRPLCKAGAACAFAGPPARASNVDLISESTKSTAAPRTNSYDTASTTSATPSRSNTRSSSRAPAARSKLRMLHLPVSAALGTGAAIASAPPHPSNAVGHGPAGVCRSQQLPGYPRAAVSDRVFHSAPPES